MGSIYSLSELYFYESKFEAQTFEFQYFNTGRGGGGGIFPQSGSAYNYSSGLFHYVKHTSQITDFGFTLN